MNVSELRDELEMLDGDLEVRFASQPGWPMEYTVDSVVQVNINSPDEDDRQIAQDMEDEGEHDKAAEIMQKPAEYIVYLAEGSQIGYLPSVASEELGWR